MAGDSPLTVAGAAAELCVETHAPHSLDLTTTGNDRCIQSYGRSTTRDIRSRINYAGVSF
jgi:hypothetical protein